MSVPANIERLLEAYNVPYDLTDNNRVLSKGESSVVSLKPYDSACAKILKGSDNSRILVIHPLDSLVDIAKINAEMQATFEPLTGKPLDDFIAQCGGNMGKVPALPVMNDLPTLVDKVLLEKDTIFLDIGVSNQFMRLEKASFKQMIGDAKIVSISRPITDIDMSISVPDDTGLIEKSISEFTERRIKQRLEDTLELPPLPITASKIIQLRVDPNADIGDLVDIVELDASLSAQVVSWAASPYYSAPGAIKSIHDAVVRVLGFDMVLNLALGLSLGKTMKMPNSNPTGCLPYWTQSVYVAAAAEAIVSCIPRQSRPSFGTAYLAGLLNNFGYLIIAEIFDTHFKDICLHIDANPQTSVQAVEKHIIGVDRDQLSSWLMGFWNMPDTLVTALRHQNNPSYDGEDWQYSLVLVLAKKMLQERGIMMGVSFEPISNAIFQRLEVDPAAVGEAIDNLLASSDDLKTIASQME